MNRQICTGKPEATNEVNRYAKRSSAERITLRPERVVTTAPGSPKFRSTVPPSASETKRTIEQQCAPPVQSQMMATGPLATSRSLSSKNPDPPDGSREHG